MNLRDNIKLFFAENGNFLLKVFGIALLIFIVIQVANDLAKQNLEQEQNISAVEENESDEIKLIRKFINLCNEQKLEEAYELLTTKCKEEKYNTKEEFIEKYYKNVFFSKMNIISIEDLDENNYKIILEEDMLATGKASDLIQIESYYKIEENYIYIDS